MAYGDMYVYLRNLHMPAHQNFALRSMRVVNILDVFGFDIKDKIIMLNGT